MTPIITIKQNFFRHKFRYSTATVLYCFQNSRCFYCNKYLRYVTYDHDRPDRFEGYTIDHLFPRSQGFGLYGNAVLACRKCNAEKDNRQPTPREIVKAWEIYNKMGHPFIASITFP